MAQLTKPYTSASQWGSAACDLRPKHLDCPTPWWWFIGMGLALISGGHKRYQRRKARKAR